MATCAAAEWKLKRYGRFIPGTGAAGRKPWKVFEANANEPGICLQILDPGYLLVLQGQESLDTIPLLGASDSLKVHQKSDNLMFRFTVRGQSRMMRMQFDGSSKAEAIKECASAMEKLMEYIPVATQEDILQHSNQTSVGESVPLKQTLKGKVAGAEPGDVKGLLSIRRLTQHFMGGTPVTLPQVNQHSSLAQVDLEPFLRVCLLDPSFPAFVEKVEGELKKMLE